MRLLISQRGVALIMVLGALLVLTTLAVEFAFNSHVAYSMALSERDRLRAFYLARSALQLAKLEISMEKEIRQRLGSQLAQLGVSTNPLCQQLPFDTALIRGMAGETEGEETTQEAAVKGEKKPSEGEKTGEDQEKVPGEAGKESSPLDQMSFLGAMGAKAFLDFQGDFAVTCADEESKINLNFFRNAEQSAEETDLTRNLYESHKGLLVNFFSQAEFQKFLKEPADGGRLAQNIADWVDRNDRINEAPGILGGAEDGVYIGPEYTYRVKNGKMASLGEMLLISGVGDDFYQAVAPHLTVHGEGKVNLCSASDLLVQAVLVHYARGLDPPLPLDYGEGLTPLVAAIREGCLQGQSRPDQIETLIQQSLGVQRSSSGGRSLRQMISSGTPRFYSLDLTGRSGEMELRIRALLDTKGKVDQWRVLHVRIQ